MTDELAIFAMCCLLPITICLIPYLYEVFSEMRIAKLERKIIYKILQTQYNKLEGEEE